MGAEKDVRNVRVSYKRRQTAITIVCFLYRLRRHMIISWTHTGKKHKEGEKRDLSNGITLAQGHVAVNQPHTNLDWI